MTRPSTFYIPLSTHPHASTSFQLVPTLVAVYGLKHGFGKGFCEIKPPDTRVGMIDEIRMTFDHIITCSVAGFAALMIVTPLFFRVFGVRNFAWSFAAAYFLFSTIFHAMFWTTYQAPQGAVALLIPIGVAIPGSLLGALGGRPVGIPLSVLGGSLQYFAIGWIVDRPFKNKGKSQHPPAN